MPPEKRKSRLYYHRLPDFARKDEKLDFLSDNALSSVDWQRLIPNQKHTWRRTDTEDEFDSFIPIGSKEAKRAKSDGVETIFKTYSGGVKTNRDVYVYGFQIDPLATRMRRFVDDYNAHVDKYTRQNRKPNIDDFVDKERIAWSRDLKLDLKRGNYAVFSSEKLRPSCIVSDYNGVLSYSQKDALWDRYFTLAPQRQRQPAELYKIVKRA